MNLARIKKYTKYIGVRARTAYDRFPSMKVVPIYDPNRYFAEFSKSHNFFSYRDVTDNAYAFKPCIKI